MKKLLTAMVLLAMVCFSGQAMALDTEACNNFPHNWGNNECVGLLDASDMVAGNPDWDNVISGVNVFSPHFPASELAPKQTPAEIKEPIIRNRRAPVGVYSGVLANGADSGLMFGGTKAGLSIPSVWVMNIDQDGDGGQDPVRGYHIDWEMNQSCQDLCDENGCPFDEQVPVPCDEPQQDTCFSVQATFNGQVVSSMGGSWISGSEFYQQGLQNATVTFDICLPPGADNDGAAAMAVTQNNMFPLSDSSIEAHPDGYPKPSLSYNAIHYSANQILLGDDNQYLQIVFDGMPFSQWEVGKSVDVIWSYHSNWNMPHYYNSTWFYDHVYRIRTDNGGSAEIISMNRPPQEECFDSVGVTAPDGTVCDWDDPNSPLIDRPMFRSTGASQLKFGDVISVTWKTGPNGPETVGIQEAPLEFYNFMKYDTGQNMLKTVDPWRGGITFYSEGFSEMAPVGIHTYDITLATGEVITVECNVESNREMPVVPATVTSEQFVVNKELGKSGKILGSIENVTVNNINAREILDENGEARLLIQWAEPDLAMTFSEFDHSVRLRMYVGDGWYGTTPVVDGYPTAHFLWIDAPVQSGSIVIPAEEYRQIREKANGPIYVGGMYREQYNTYHNRGYFSYILIP